jgi:hypothetical protein
MASEMLWIRRYTRKFCELNSDHLGIGKVTFTCAILVLGTLLVLVSPRVNQSGQIIGAGENPLFPEPMRGGKQFAELSVSPRKLS